MIERAPPGATCRIFTFKEGVLSAIAHDLELDVARFSVSWAEDQASVRATFDAGSLAVLWAIRGGAPDPNALSAADRAKIEAALRDEVLESRRFPEISFGPARVEKDGPDALRLSGPLRLHGHQRELGATARRRGDRWECEVELSQPDYGITPYRAAFGALKVKPRLLVRLSVPGA